LWDGEGGWLFGKSFESASERGREKIEGIREEMGKGGGKGFMRMNGWVLK
jgi:hypothetical protein